MKSRSTALRGAPAPIPALPPPSPTFQVPRWPVSPAIQPSRRRKVACPPVRDPLGGRAGWIVAALLLLLSAKPLVELAGMVAADIGISHAQSEEPAR